MLCATQWCQPYKIISKELVSTIKQVQAITFWKTQGTVVKNFYAKYVPAIFFFMQHTRIVSKVWDKRLEKVPAKKFYDIGIKVYNY